MRFKQRYCNEDAIIDEEEDFVYNGIPIRITRSEGVTQFLEIKEKPFIREVIDFIKSRKCK